MLRSLSLLIVAASVFTTLPSRGAAQTVRGSIVDADTGEPVMLAYVGLLGEGREVVVADLADDRGGFRLEAPRQGSYFLYVRRDGYETLLDGVFELGRDGVFDVRVGLTPEPIEIEPVDVGARRSLNRLESSGFYDRVLTAPGVFLSREDIARAGGSMVSDVFRAIPRVEIDTSRPLTGPNALERPSIIMRRGTEQCSPTLYIDRHMVATGVVEPVRPDDWVSPSEIEAVEIYTRASEVPVEFDAVNGCGVILIWTRMR